MLYAPADLLICLLARIFGVRVSVVVVPAVTAPPGPQLCRDLVPRRVVVPGPDDLFGMSLDQVKLLTGDTHSVAGDRVGEPGTTDTGDVQRGLNHNESAADLGLVVDHCIEAEEREGLPDAPGIVADTIPAFLLPSPWLVRVWISDGNDPRPVPGCPAKSSPLVMMGSSGRVWR